MQSVGTRLREAREKRGFSLEEINARTRINSKNLVAIERDQVSTISSPFFYRSFVRQYAEQVGLDFEILAPGVEELAGIMRQPDLPGQGEHQMLRVAPIQARPKRDFSWLVPSAAFLAIVALGSGGYTALKYYRPQVMQALSFLPLFRQNGTGAADIPNTASVRIIEPAKVAQPEKAPLSRSTPTVVVVPMATNPVAASLVPSLVTPPVLAPVADRIHLELAITERTWLSVMADGKTAYSGVLEPLQTKILEGQDSAKLKTGNAGGVTVIFNGKMLGPIGPHGTKRVVFFSKTGYEIRTSEKIKQSRGNHIGG
jgi:transcriptional regulator with XRE-family HTH domain